VGHLADVINRANFQPNWFEGYRATGTENHH